jgi:hypothetical protein
MSQKSRSDCFKSLQYHYLRATNLASKGALLDSAVNLLGVGRKYLIRKFGTPCDSRGPKPRTGRPVEYDAGVKAALKSLWLAMDQPCSKHLKAGLPLWLPSWEARHGAFSTEVRLGLERISPAQMDRLLKDVRVKCGKKKPRSEANNVRHQIPIRQGPWETTGPGWFEVDTVFHNGGDPSGSFARSLCATDIYSAWTEVRATWNQSQMRVHERLSEMEGGLPFPMLGYDSDNGTEVLNSAVVSYFRGRLVPVLMTRSRPHQSNDNAHVEQKNRTHVREFIGYERIGDLALVEPLNSSYIAWSLWRNLYRPSSKLLSRERQGSRVIKKHEKTPMTPAQRILEHPQVSEEIKARIRQLLQDNDPLTLWDTVQGHLKRFVAVQKSLQAAQEGAAARMR